MTEKGIGLDKVGLVPVDQQQPSDTYTHRCFNITCGYEFESDSPFNRCHLCGYPTLGKKTE